MAVVPGRLLSATFALVFFVAGCGGGSTPSGTTPQAAPPMGRAAMQQRPLPDFRHMRAVHVMGNWSGNTVGFKAPLLSDAPLLTASAVAIKGSVSSFVDPQGATRTNDMAEVTLTNVQVGEKVYAKAGFWVYRETSTGAMGLQFRPQLDANLAGITGFGGDVNINIPASVDGDVFPAGLDQAGGDALAYVKAVLAHAPELVAAATQVTLGTGATTGQPANLSASLANLRGALNSGDSRFFAHLKSMNVEWLGVSVALHYDNYMDPTVRARVCANGLFQDSAGNPTPCTFPDADLVSFLERARAQGFKIYLTLAFEPSQELDDPASPTCGTPQFKMSRWWLGAPEIPSGSPASHCIPAGSWWWNPAHPEHATKVAAFWSSFQLLAVKYAQIAEDTGVELYSIGTETDRLFRTRAGTGAYTNHFRTQLQAMVAAVRAVYGGAVTYDQHYSFYEEAIRHGDTTGTTHLFNDLALDVVGLSAYFQLVPSAPGRVMSVAEFETAWRRVFQETLEPIRAAYPNKPIVFTEVGYTDHLDTPFFTAAGEGSPKPPGAVTPGMTQQANVLQALFNVNAEKGDLLAGLFLWGNDYFPTNGSGCSLVSFGLHCSPPARDVVTAAYRAWQRKDADRVFDWAKAVYPSVFGGATSTGVLGDYYYRYHPMSGLYLGLHEATGELFLHDGVTYNLVSAGGLRAYLDPAGRSGF